MRAFILMEPEKLELIETTAKDPEEGEIQIKTMACGICGTDFHAYYGKHLAVEYPVIPGHELSGIVSKTGKKIKSFKPGDRVVVDPNITCGHCEYCKEGKENFCENMRSVGINYPGGYGEYVTVPEKVVYKIPDNMSFGAAAMTEPVACIVHAFETTPVHLGGSAIILGTGFIGLTFLQILKGMGYYPIYVMGRNPVRNKIAGKYGADMIYTNIDDLMKSSITGKAGVVIEATGDNNILSKTVDMVAPSGKIFAFSVYPPEENVSINSNKIYSKEISIFGDFINPYTMRKAINMISSGLIDYAGMEDHIINLEDVSDLFTSGKKNFIKPLIVYK
jgi:2-desacetyl-2-hydroxyethyl bacteriochlorophyllide A dehydrogenase